MAGAAGWTLRQLANGQTGESSAVVHFRTPQGVGGKQSACGEVWTKRSWYQIWRYSLFLNKLGLAMHPS